jgi:hypothetical protein
MYVYLVYHGGIQCVYVRGVSFYIIIVTELGNLETYLYIFYGSLFLYSRCWQFRYRFEGIFSLFLIIVDMINLDGNFRRYLDYFCLKDMIMHMHAKVEVAQYYVRSTSV